MLQLTIFAMMGIGSSELFLLIILGLPTFFLWRWLLGTFIKANKARTILSWVATIILTPAILIALIIFMFSNI